jgi:acyl carrier protein
VSDESSKRPGILKVIHAVSDLADDPSDDESLFDSGALDSFSLPDLVTGLEQQFNVKIPDADLVPERFDTVAKIEAYLDTRQG